MSRLPLVLVLAVATGLTAAPTGEASLSCRKQGVRPITRTTHARVFARCRGRELAYYAQLRNRRPIRLDFPRCCEAVRLATLAGRCVAYVQEQVVKDRDEFSVRVVTCEPVATSTTGRKEHSGLTRSITGRRRSFSRRRE